MTSLPIATQCFEQLRSSGLSIDKQNEIASQVLRSIRPE